MKLFTRRNKAEAKGTQVVLRIEGMHCTSCGLLTDDELEDIPGVRSAAADVRTGRSVVIMEEGVDVDTAVLVAAVEAAGITRPVRPSDRTTPQRAAAAPSMRPGRQVLRPGRPAGQP
ncbi:cation transporter [Streptomyces sp. NPDC005202]|uniref:cation transporter n=1 Tax=Streptomyces sp. NPDC005202 TaxID=3157021 RepID=UPI0033B0DFC8